MTSLAECSSIKLFQKNDRDRNCFNDESQYFLVANFPYFKYQKGIKHNLKSEPK